MPWGRWWGCTRSPPRRWRCSSRRTRATWAKATPVGAAPSPSGWRATARSSSAARAQCPSTWSSTKTACSSATPRRCGGCAAATPPARCCASANRAAACARSCASGAPARQQVSYACVITETYRHFGRLGLGAVFGSKQLKAIVIEGKRNLPVADRKAFRQTYDAIFKAATESPLMKKYHELGTPMNVIPLDAIGGLPTRNLQSGRFEGAEAISGEALAANYLGRRVACAHCPVACIHLAALRIPYPNDPYFYKTLMLGYDHEPIFATGSMLGLDDVPGMLQVMDEIEVQGLDVMSAGVALAWATEAFEHGLITQADTDGLALAFGDAATYIEAVKRIVTQPTDFYRALARGVEHAASIYGGADFRAGLRRQRDARLPHRPGAATSATSPARATATSTARGYSLDQKAAKAGQTLTPEGVAETLIAGRTLAAGAHQPGRLLLRARCLRPRNHPRRASCGRIRLERRGPGTPGNRHTASQVRLQTT